LINFDQNTIVMKTLTYKEDISLDRDESENLEDFQNYPVSSFRLNSHHKRILDDRIAGAKENPEDYIKLGDLKKSFSSES